MASLLASVVVATTGLYFVGFALACWFAPAATGRFLHSFAASAQAHYLELSVRAVIGLAFVERSPSMAFSPAFRLAGWILFGTTLGLCCVPWSWHRRIAERSVPSAVQHLQLIGIAAIAAGLGRVFKRDE